MVKHDCTVKMYDCDFIVNSTYFFFFLSLPVCEQQLYSVCKNMQTRVVELIPQLEDEGFIEELLMVNDDLNNAFIRYERSVVAFIQGFKELYCHTSTRLRKRW